MNSISSPSHLTFDVCIVGAGPAGLSAAQYLSNVGASVCIVEKRTSPGTKACGGGLTKESAGRIPTSGGVAHSRLRVISGRWQTTIDTAEPFMVTANRAGWQTQWLDDLEQSGVGVFRNTRCSSIAADVLMTDRGPLRCGFIIGADGAASRVRRSLGLPTAIGIIALQLSGVKNLASAELPSVWFQPALFGAGYAWSFPHSDGAHVGVGVPTCTFSSAQLKLAFHQFLRQIKLAPSDGTLQAGSIGCRYSGHRFGRVFLCGDAAGLASPVTGEGISQALISGEEVAREICDRSYRSAVLASLSASHRRTFDLLTHPIGGAVAYSSAALLLKIPLLATLAMGRYSR